MKRRQAGFRPGNLAQVSEGEQGFWPSYADMMSSFALILFFLMLIAYLQNLITGNNLVSTQELLEQTERTLQSTALQVDEAKKELGALTLTLDEARASIAAQQEEMAVYAATIEGQATTIDEQTKAIAAQKEYIALTTEELTRLRSQMQSIAFLRLSILEQIKESIAQTLGDSSKVSIGENGSIILNEGLFFDYNSAKVKSASYALLDELTAAFSQFLEDEENARYVDSIVISGHTDDRGAAERNRELSTERANAVLNYLLSAEDGALTAYEAFFCAAGYGSTRPVASNDAEEGRSVNRRIEISIILKDETVLDIVESYLAQQMPLSATPSPAPSATPQP